MHVLFVHPNYPAQFRCIAPALARDGWTCTFATRNAKAAELPGVPRIIYQPCGGATRATHFAARTFENTVGHAHGVYAAMQARPDVVPDLVVAHSGFGSSLFLPYLYDAPIINFFEYYYRPLGQDFGYRPEAPVTQAHLLRNRCRNGMILLDLDNCDRGWSPNEYQRGLFPRQFHDKIEVIPEGIDTTLYRRSEVTLKVTGGRALPDDMRIVTYVSRGFELMRGFDIFMRAAQVIARQCPNVIFIVVGTERAYYGGDTELTGGRSLSEHVVRTYRCDLSRFAFPGTLSEQDLAHVLSISDLHIYLTVPFVPSWSLLDAMSCGCVVLASDQACTREYITHGQNGLLCGFFDVEGIAAKAVKVLNDPAQYRPLGDAARETVRRRYSLEVTLPRIKKFFEEVAATKRQPSVRAKLLVREGTGLGKPAMPSGRKTRQHLVERARDVSSRAIVPRRQPKRVLLVGELGAALGHILPMRPVVEALEARGHAVALALRDCALAPTAFGAARASLHQAPYKGAGRPVSLRTFNFAYILATVGWATDSELSGLASAWRNLFRQLDPDLVWFDHSPTALLAARWLPPRVKKVVTGPGFFCPPDVSPFPALITGEVDAGRLVEFEERVLHRANGLLARWNRPPIPRLGELYSAVDETFLTTFPELDHYPQRPPGTKYWGPIHAAGGTSPPWPTADGKRVYAYLKNSPHVADVLRALVELGGPTVVFADGIDPDVRREFEAVPTMRFEGRRLDMARVRDECDVAVLNANHGTLCQLLLGGKPMLQVPLTLEQRVLARRVDALGASETVWARGDAAPEEVRRKLHAVATEPRYADAARGFALKYASFDPEAQVRRMVDRIEELMQSGRRGTQQIGPQGDENSARRRAVFAG